MNRPKGRHAVFVGEIPDNYWPFSVMDVPDRLQNVEILRRRLTLSQASRLVRDHNQVQKARAIPDGRWAFLVFQPKEARP